MVRSGVIRRPSRIATVSIGYADGMPRAAGNGFSLLVRGSARISLAMLHGHVYDRYYAYPSGSGGMR